MATAMRDRVGKKAPPRPCAVCAVVFKPHFAGMGKYCSRKCACLGRTKTVSQRFWQKVAPFKSMSECWLWTGPTSKWGYGMLKVGDKNTPASRVAYVLMHGSIPDDYLACHRCDNPPCVNPFHLFAGTASDNMRDMVAKGRGRYPSADKTHCQHGHEFTAENTYVHRGCRSCRICRRHSLRQFKARRRLAA